MGVGVELLLREWLPEEVGDVDDHRLSLSTFSGLAFFADDVVAKVRFHSIADYVAGAGTFTLYPVIRFDDDSTLSSNRAV